MIFIKDRLFGHEPSSAVSGRTPKDIVWNREDSTLDKHFYTHFDILETVGSPTKLYAWFIESKAIAPRDYEIFFERFGLHKDFDLIFTNCVKMLNTFENAVFSPGGGVWYGGTNGGGTISSNKIKTKNISMVSSDKVMCPMHSLRLSLIRELKKYSNIVDTMGTFDGGKSIKIHESLDDYRYSIVVENHIEDYYFTEKIMNCFASMTIPIYIGANRISKFFNSDGIIQIDIQDINNIGMVLSRCNDFDYQTRKSAIMDNLWRVQKYLTIEDYISGRYNI